MNTLLSGDCNHAKTQGPHLKCVQGKGKGNVIVLVVTEAELTLF